MRTFFFAVFEYDQNRLSATYCFIHQIYFFYHLVFIFHAILLLFYLLNFTCCYFTWSWTKSLWANVCKVYGSKDQYLNINISRYNDVQCPKKVKGQFTIFQIIENHTSPKDVTALKLITQLY